MAKAKNRGSRPKRREGVTDFHVHIQPWKMFRPEAIEKIRERRTDLNQVIRETEIPDNFLKCLDDAGIQRACCVNYVSPDVVGFTADVNEWISTYCSEAPERLLSVGSIHPRLTPNVDQEMERLCGDLGIRMLKIHPPHQFIYPNQYRDGLHAIGAIYRKAQEFRVPVMIHTGTSVFPGARNKFGQPIHCDDIGVDFPDLTVILAHGGRPLWMEEAFFLIRRHPNFYMDISGIPMKRLMEFFPRLEEVSDKVLFGSDWPGPLVPDPAQNLKDFEELPIREDSKQKILVTNAQKVLP